MKTNVKEKKYSLASDDNFKFVLSHDYITKYIIETAKNLINLKVPINVIQKATGLSKKKILSL